MNQTALELSGFLVAEATKIAFADRAWWLGDRNFVKVPRSLLDKSNVFLDGDVHIFHQK